MLHFWIVNRGVQAQQLQLHIFSVKHQVLGRNVGVVRWQIVHTDAVLLFLCLRLVYSCLRNASLHRDVSTQHKRLTVLADPTLAQCHREADKLVDGLIPRCQGLHRG